MLALLGILVATGKSGYQAPSRRKFLWKQLSLGRGKMPVPQDDPGGSQTFCGSRKALAWLLSHMNVGTWSALPLPLSRV